MELSTIGLFVIAAATLIIMPGPSVFYIMARSMDQGRKAGLVSVLGVCLGGSVHVAAAVIGVSAILMTSATAFNIVKYLGAAYLIYLGIKTLLSAPDRTAAEMTAAPRKALAKIFGQSVLVEVMNPKTALFFLAFFPQFISPSAGSVTGQFALLGTIFVLLALICDCLYAVLAASIRKRIMRREGSSTLRNRITGYFYIVLGIFSALASPSSS